MKKRQPGGGIDRVEFMAAEKRLHIDEDGNIIGDSTLGCGRVKSRVKCYRCQ
jgi:hypothetical protein